MANDTYNNDNEPLTFQSLGLAAAIVINRIRNAQALRELANSDEKEEIKRDGKHDPNSAREEKEEVERADIERRMRDILAMENRLRRKRI